MDHNNRNFIAAIALSLAVILSWQIFFVAPRAEKARQQQIAEQQKAAAAKAEADRTNSASTPAGAPAPAAPAAGSTAALNPAPGAQTFPTREAALAANPRVKIDTPVLVGSINLKGGRIDDVILRNYTVKVDPASDKEVLLSPSGTATPFYAKLGILPGTQGLAVPTDETVWQQEGTNTLSQATPVVLRHDNGAGLIFRRTISVDDRYMFSIVDEVENKGTAPVSLRWYGQVARLYEPTTTGYTVLHEGLIGLLGKTGLKELTYADAVKNFDPSTGQVKETVSDTGGWIGFTDQYWAAVLIPDQGKRYNARLFGNGRKQFYADITEDPVTIAPGEKVTNGNRLFAGAKEVATLDKYMDQYKIERFNRLIDWGWFPFLTQPMFYTMDFFFRQFGNFGVAILLTTVLVKLLFFPLANKSYQSMSKMKLLQPQLKQIQERFKDDRARQQQAMMELYRKEKINPAAGCLPIFIQIPVFFALYKVLLVTIEMRHAPFVGWIKDLSAPDPTSIFNLFGLIPWTPPHLLMVGVLPILMGISMWIQMRLNPTPPDPIQQQIFTYMPIVFTFMLAAFPAGLVLYWTWNNLLSFAQQAIIMKQQDENVDIMQNIGLKRLQARVKSLPNRTRPNGGARKPAE
jgi:YidC/Oxa1 family membrane protein insertase